MRKAGQSSRRRRLGRQLRLFPRQFWLLVGGTFFYLLVIGLAFPYTAILIKERLGVSMAVVGAIMGGTALAGLPLQPLAGSLSDRFGRRAVMIVCCCCSGVMYGSLAFAHGFWPICLAVFCDRALGWPLFLTASNAMVADLVRARLRPEGYSLVRLMIGAGEVVGPLIAAALLAAGFGLSLLFVLAGAGCFAFLVFVVVALRETRPRVARHVRSTAVSEGPAVYGVRDVIRIPSRRRSRRRRAARRRAERRRSARRAPQGYRRVLADRRFCAFCAGSLLPLLNFGQMY
jgi:MFS family permease